MERNFLLKVHIICAYEFSYAERKKIDLNYLQVQMKTSVTLFMNQFLKYLYSAYKCSLCLILMQTFITYCFSGSFYSVIHLMGETDCHEQQWPVPRSVLITSPCHPRGSVSGFPRVGPEGHFISLHTGGWQFFLPPPNCFPLKRCSIKVLSFSKLAQ